MFNRESVELSSLILQQGVKFQNMQMRNNVFQLASKEQVP